MFTKVSLEGYCCLIMSFIAWLVREGYRPQNILYKLIILSGSND